MYVYLLQNILLRWLLTDSCSHTIELHGVVDVHI
jgi:hypothetical protein